MTNSVMKRPASAGGDAAARPMAELQPVHVQPARKRKKGISAASAPVATSKAIPADCVHATAFGTESDSVGWGAGEWRKGVGDRHMGIGREEKDVAETQSAKWDALDVAGCGACVFRVERSVRDAFRGHSLQYCLSLPQLFQGFIPHSGTQAHSRTEDGVEVGKLQFGQKLKYLINQRYYVYMNISRFPD
ncbi:hypothetical protein C8R44DRAFT_848709 [Mycena epipterygia]|nr:hypothetical protein C8R44DRAFT_848709 [Mycena epipterygia]